MNINKKKFISLIFIVVMFSVLTAASQILAVRFYRKAVKEMHEKNYHKAIEYFNKVIEIEPTAIGDFYKDTFHKRGYAKIQLGDFTGAIEDYDKALKLKPKTASIYYNKGDAQYNLENYREAIQDYDKAIEIKPSLAQAYVNRGIAYSHLGQYEKAIADYEKGLELNPKIDNKPSFFQRLFSNDPNTEKGIRQHLEFLKQKVKDS